MSELYEYRIEDHFSLDQIGKLDLGITFDRVYEDEDGRMWVCNNEYLSRVNFCPMTGRPARLKIGEEA